MTSAPPDAVRGTIYSEWRRHWRIGGAVMTSTALGYTVWPTISSLFVEPLQQAFGWTRGQIALTFYSTMVASLFAPVIGRIVDRIGVRRVLLPALALVAFGYLLLALLPGSLPSYYAVSVFLAVSGMATSAVTYAKLVTGTFRDTRGSALAIVRSGLAVAAIILPPLLVAATAAWTFRAGFLILAGLILFVALPICWAWVPRHSIAVADMASSSSGPEPTIELIKNPRVVILCLAAALNYAPVVAILTQLKPLGIANGLTSEVAVAAVSAIGLAAFAGAFLSGLLIDRFWAPGVAFLLNMASAGGCLLLLFGGSSPSLFLIGVLLIGIGQGAEIDIVAFIIARWFGLRSYSTIYGFTALTIAMFIAVAAGSIGMVYDHFGSYDPAIVICAASFVAAALLYLAMGRPPGSARVDSPPSPKLTPA